MLYSIALQPDTDATSPRVQSFQVIKSFPHDAQAFTQGLFFYKQQLYESTGLWGQSSIRKVDLETGHVQRSTPLSPEYFGEGATFCSGSVYQITYKRGTAFVYDPDRLKKTGEHPYEGDGWGLTCDGKHLILSDGTDTLRFYEPKTFRVAKKLRVKWAGQPLEKINELEYINGEVWANIFMSEFLVRIDPTTGKAVGLIDLAGLMPRKGRHTKAVLNGIAYEREGKRLFVTGKFWPKLFEIRVIEPTAGPRVSEPKK
jgi:glutamine cyclotransferase